jgi:hypothetical protein
MISGICGNETWRTELEGKSKRMVARVMQETKKAPGQALVEYGASTPTKR